MQINSANSLDKNTFKVNQLLKIPNSDLILIVDELFGVYIYDLDFLIILKEIDLRKDNIFNDQSERNNGVLQVFTVIAIVVFIFDADPSINDTFVLSISRILYGIFWP